MEHPMILHRDPEAMREAMFATARFLDLAAVLVEKDYWVTYVLRALADSPYRDQLVFKGGTALSKAYGLIERFSEDVDLAIAGTEGWTGGRLKKLMDNAARHITQDLEADPTAPGTVRGSHFRKTLHRFPITSDSPVQLLPQLRGGAVLLEINAFARPYPSQWQPVQSYIGQMLTRQGQQELEASYGLQPFEVLTLSLERTLVEKVLALVRAGYAPDPIAELQAKVRHVYDLHQLLQQPALQKFLNGDDFTHLVAEVRADDARNQEFQGNWATRPLAEAAVFADVAGTWPRLLTTYQGAFRQLVHGKLPTPANVSTTLTMIGNRLRTLDTLV
jgi:predicted nucleotidyltransferase component of viral defense system